MVSLRKQSLDVPKNRVKLIDLCSPVESVMPGKTPYSAFPRASKTIGRSSDITSFSVWMKRTLRAQAFSGGGKGSHRNCVSSSH